MFDLVAKYTIALENKQVNRMKKAARNHYDTLEKSKIAVGFKLINYCTIHHSHA
jgi:hypothetical protein